MRKISSKQRQRNAFAHGDYVIRIAGSANGMPCSVAGRYLESFDPDAHDGRGRATYTANRSKTFALVYRERPKTRATTRKEIFTRIERVIEAACTAAGEIADKAKATNNE
jgi:hypothetical protein